MKIASFIERRQAVRSARELGATRSSPDWDWKNIKVSTVGTYVQRIHEKLHVRSRHEIIARYKGGG
jgi:hypothetical protein